MKKYNFHFKSVAMAFACGLALTSCGDSQQGKVAVAPEMIGTGNPYLPLWEHLPDGEPRVFEDPDNPGKFRAYIIGSHDLRLDSYCGPDIRMWSAPVEDLTDWRDEGPLFTYQIDGKWDVMYAPDLSKWYFNQMLGLGDEEHNRRLREERENKRPIITDTRQEIVLWSIWIYYQKDIMRRLAQQKGAMGGGMPQPDDD